MKWFSAAAEQGLPEAQNSLGIVYANGRGVPRNYTEAVQWFSKAANQGYAPGQQNLGDMYFGSLGVPHDDKKAFELYSLAAEHGSEPAQESLAFMYLKGRGVPMNTSLAVEWYRKLAEKGVPTAELQLASLYLQGIGVPKSQTEAVRWYKRASEHGSALSQLSLGEMYLDGKAGPKKEGEGVRLIRSAAERGSSEAQFVLGVLYETGRVLPRDPGEALHWLREAAEQGHQQARDRIATVFNSITSNASTAEAWRSRLEAAFRSLGDHCEPGQHLNFETTTSTKAQKVSFVQSSWDAQFAARADVQNGNVAASGPNDLRLLEDIEMARFDASTGTLILVGPKASAESAINIDHFLSIFRSLGQPEAPGVSIDPSESPDYMQVRYFGGVQRSTLGAVLFEADRTMKCSSSNLI